jgi:hypothetical protein
MLQTGRSEVCRDWLWDPPSLLFDVYWGSFPGVKRLGHEAIPLLLIMSLHGVDRENCTFNFHILHAGTKGLIKRPMKFINKWYTGCNRRKGPDFGRVFLMLNYTNITQNTYIQSWTVMEIMAIEMCGLLGCRRTVRRPWCHTCPMCTSAQDMVMQSAYVSSDVIR